MTKNELFSIMDAAYQTAYSFGHGREGYDKSKFFYCFDGHPFEPFENLITDGQHRDRDVSIKKCIDNTSWHKYIVTMPTAWLYGANYDWATNTK